MITTRGMTKIDPLTLYRNGHPMDLKVTLSASPYFRFLSRNQPHLHSRFPILQHGLVESYGKIIGVVSRSD